MSSSESYSSGEFYSSDEFCSSGESRSSHSPLKLLVKPAPAKNTLVPEDWESTISFWNDGVKVSGRSRLTSPYETSESGPPATPLKDDASINVQPDDNTPSDVILVKPASAENTLVHEEWERTFSFWNDGVTVSGSSRLRSVYETSERETHLKDDASINVQPDDSTPDFHIFPSDVILVKPASAENTLVPEAWESTISFWNDGVKVSGRSRLRSLYETSERETHLKDDASINVQPDDSTPDFHTFPSDVILVKPASAENTLVPKEWESTISFWNDGVKVSGRSRLTSPNETSESDPPATPLKDDASINVQPDDSTPSDVILVKPASAENTLVPEEWESTISFWNDGVKVSGRSRVTSPYETSEQDPPAMPLTDDASINVQPDDSTSDLHILPSDVLLVKPASAENTLVLDNWDCALSFWNDAVKASGRSTFAYSDETFEDVWPSARPPKAVASIPSGEVLVRTETAENAEDRESALSFQSGSITHEDIGTKTKKKKNCARRFFSWMRRTFCCCVARVEDD